MSETQAIWLLHVEIIQTILIDHHRISLPEDHWLPGQGLYSPLDPESTREQHGLS